MSCKISSGIVGAGGSACTPKQGGNRELHIASKFAILTYLISAPPSPVVSDIDLNNDPLAGGDVDNKFYKFATKDKKLKFMSTEKYDMENESTTYENLIEGTINNDNPQAIHALRSLFGKPLCIIVKENGQNGRWKISGLTGGEDRGLYLTEIIIDDGEALTETQNKLPRIKIEGVMDDGWYYLDAGSPAATEALIATLTA